VPASRRSLVTGEEIVDELEPVPGGRRPPSPAARRSCITLAVLTALHCAEELPLHVRGALNNGLAPEEIKEVLLHTAVYAGVPAANSAFAVARRTLDELTTQGGVPDPAADRADLNP
jgi:hypothetical protein